jgi:hypothetical protein
MVDGENGIRAIPNIQPFSQTVASKTAKHAI